MQTDLDTTALEEIMDVRGRGMPDTGEITNTGADPVLETRFKIGETCAAVVAGIGIAVSDIWELKTGKRQNAAVDVRHANAALRSNHYIQMPDENGTFADVVTPENEMARNLTQPFPTKDGRWCLPHFGLPNLRKRTLDLLKCEPNLSSAANAVKQWNAIDLEHAIDEARVCGAMVRSNAEWLAHPHGKVLAAKPIVEIIKIGDSDPEPFPAGDRPLSGIRALDLTRILAGPIAARTLAENGADVLMVTAEHLPQIVEHVLDTSHGKRSCFLDLKTTEGIDQLKHLVRSGDVFSQGYRPESLAKLGLAPDDLAALRPGIVYLSISCYGADGPLSHRAGWEQVAQTVTGICHEGSPDRPKLLPAAACDYTTGYLGAYGALIALARRAREGGSYHVRVSLCQSGMFIYRQGKTNGNAAKNLTADEIDALRVETATAHGPVRHLSPILKLSETQPHWTLPTPKLGSSKPEWLSSNSGFTRI